MAPIVTSHYSLPPFDPTVSVASLPIIPLHLLLANEPTASQRLYEASRSVGFFYLDLAGCVASEKLIRESEELFSLAKDFMALPRREKERYGDERVEKGWGYRYIEDEERKDEDEANVRKYEGYGVRKDDLFDLVRLL